MSERDDSLSGNKPAERKPTIIGGGNGVKKPTVISGETVNKPAENSITPPPTSIAPSKLTPTSIKPEIPAEQKERKPTAISIQSKSVDSPKSEQTPVRQPVAIKIQNAPPPKPLVIEKPSVMHGVVRKGIEITKDDLGNVFPGTPETVLARAKEVLSSTVMEILSESRCMQWGANQQEKYAALVDQSLKLSTSKVITEGSRHVRRLFELLQELACCFQDQGASFAFWKKRETPLEKFQALRPEIDQLSSVLRQSLPTMVDIQSKLDSVASDLQKLVIELDAESISARYIADQLTGKTEKQSVAQRLLDRSLSLAQTAAYIQQGDVMRQSANLEIGKLVSRIQDVVLVKLPAWMEQVSMSQIKSLTETDMYMFRQGLDNVVQQLT